MRTVPPPSASTPNNATEPLRDPKGKQTCAKKKKETAAQPLTTLANDGTLSLGMTQEADVFQVAHLKTNTDGTEAIAVKNLATGWEEIFGDIAGGAAIGVRNIAATGGPATTASPWNARCSTGWRPPNGRSPSTVARGMTP